MFGYVRPLKGELKVREYEMYQAAYCGLCRSMKRNYGNRSTLLLNYDLTFLAVLMLALKGQQGYMDRRCVASPLKRKRMCAPCAPLDECAGYAVILGCEKLRDDRRDKNFWQSLPSRAALLFFHRAEKRAGKDWPAFKKDVQDALAQLDRIEREHSPIMDAAADTFASILSSAGGNAEGEAGEHLRRLLYHVGRWVYIADAADDLKKDMADGNYNAVALRFDMKEALLDEETQAYLLSTMDMSADLAADEALSLQLGNYRGIIDNILIKGIPFISRKVLKGEWHKKRRTKMQIIQKEAQNTAQRNKAGNILKWEQSEHERSIQGARRIT